MLETAAFSTNSSTLVLPSHKTILAETRDVVFKTNDKILIDRINLRLSSEPITMVMGPNGAGKSLLLRLLHGMVEPTSGHILWGGHPLSEDIRKKQAMVFQRPVLLRRSVAANIGFVLGMRGLDTKQRRQQVLEKAGLSSHANQPARLLSGGEQQRLALARALALDPEVLFLDEPTASLDPYSVSLIEDIIKAESRRGTKIIFVTHDSGQARRLAGDIMFIHRGRLLEHTTTEQFFESPGSKEAKSYVAGEIVI